MDRIALDYVSASNRKDRSERPSDGAVEVKGDSHLLGDYHLKVNWQ